MESGVVKEDFWDEIGFDTRAYISSPYYSRKNNGLEGERVY